MSEKFLDNNNNKNKNNNNSDTPLISRHTDGEKKEQSLHDRKSRNSTFYLRWSNVLIFRRF